MQAEVWKREQEKAHEERKVEEMKKEIAEERKMQELTDQAAEAGHVQKVERLEFMYKGGPGMGGPGMGVQSEDVDAYLMGEKKFEAPAGDDALARARDAPGSLLAAHPDPPAAKSETWNKLNSDPLLTMRVQEQEARRAIAKDPARAARARAELERARREKKEKKRRRKEEKKAAKRERKARIRAEVRREVLGEDLRSGESGRVDSRRAAREKNEGKKKRRRRSASTRSSDSESSHDSDSDSDSHARRRGKRARSRSRSRETDADRRSSRDDRKSRNARRGARGDARDRRRFSPLPSPRPAARAVRDGASAQDASKGYGLTYANERGERAAAVRRERRDEWREATRDSREAEDEAARRAAREKEARWANRARGARNTVGHETGKMSEEERAARLAAMASDAAAHDASRVSRLREGAERAADGGEKSLGRLAASAPERHHSEAAPFLEKAQREAFGGSGGKGGLEDRIGTTKYYKQRGGGD